MEETENMRKERGRERERDGKREREMTKYERLKKSDISHHFFLFSIF